MVRDGVDQIGPVPTAPSGPRQRTIEIEGGILSAPLSVAADACRKVDPSETTLYPIQGCPAPVAADACAILGLDTNKGTYMHLAKLGPDEKLLAKRNSHPKLFLGSRASR